MFLTHGHRAQNCKAQVICYSKASGINHIMYNIDEKKPTSKCIIHVTSTCGWFKGTVLRKYIDQLKS